MLFCTDWKSLPIRYHVGRFEAKKEEAARLSWGGLFPTEEIASAKVLRGDTLDTVEEPQEALVAGRGSGKAWSAGDETLKRWPGETL